MRAGHYILFFLLSLCFYPPRSLPDAEAGSDVGMLAQLLSETFISPPPPPPLPSLDPSPILLLLQMFWKMRSNLSHSQLFLKFPERRKEKSNLNIVPQSFASYHFGSERDLQYDLT
jgi:hypothetical protein